MLAKKLVTTGTENVTVGTPIAIVVENKDDVSAFANYKLEPIVEVKTAASSKQEQVDEKPKPPLRPKETKLASPSTILPQREVPSPSTPRYSKSNSDTFANLLFASSWVEYEEKYGPTLLVSPSKTKRVSKTSKA